jgi:hypothetical protein
MLIRADMCMTFEVPDGTTIEHGAIHLPNGNELACDPDVNQLTPDGDVLEVEPSGTPGISYHTYYTTPVEADRTFVGGAS